MLITRQHVIDQLGAYFNGRVPLARLIEWAEQQMMHADFASPTVRDVVARIGLADVRAFGLTWEDCQGILRDLGFAAHVQIGAAN